jgi:4-hydroxybutyrate dehydrogenase
MATPAGISAFSFPNRILFGEGARRELAAELDRLGATRPLVVTDRALVDSGLVDEVVRPLRSASVFAGVHPNPAESDCLAGLDVYRARACDGVVGLGGGSALDAAKGIRLLATHPGRLADYDVTDNGPSRITANLPPMAAVPTTAGTGSEASRSALIRLPQTGRKTAIISPYLLPSVALCDPELTLGLPPVLTAGTGMDAFTHAIESYLSTTFHPICDGIALEALKHMGRGLEAAVRDGSDRAARAEMTIGALLAGISFHKGLGIVHALAHALGSEADAPHHGTVNAILLPHALRFNRAAAEPKMVELAVRMGLSRTTDAAGHLITLTELLIARMPLPTRLGDLRGLSRERIPHYAALAERDHCLRTNPRPATRDDLELLLERAW